MLFISLLNKMKCTGHLIISLIFCQRIMCHPYGNSNNSTNPSIQEQMIEMGRGLEQIPIGTPIIRTLNLAYNHISTLPGYIFQNNSYRALTKIELYQNKINNISLQAFRGLRHLTNVDLSDNNLTEIDHDTFKLNGKLLKLDLSRNKLNFNRGRVFLMSHTLEILILSQNRIEQIYDVTFMGVPNLKNLIIDHNVLFMLSSNCFKPLRKLQYLSIANTGVYRLSVSMFDELPRIINLQDTPLAKRFDPPLKKITNNAVQSLINIDQYLFNSETTI